MHHPFHLLALRRDTRSSTGIERLHAAMMTGEKGSFDKVDARTKEFTSSAKTMNELESLLL